MKNLADQSHILMVRNDAPVVYRDTAAFLTPVLQGQKAVISGIGRRHDIVSIQTENAALFMRLFGESYLV